MNYIYPAFGTTLNLEPYIRHIKADYAKWKKKTDGKLSTISKDMIKDFNENIRIVEGRNCLRIETSTSIHSFVVLRVTSAMAKCRDIEVGSILKAANWKAPTLNFARGHLDDAEYSQVRWTGI